MKTVELWGVQLDYAVATCEGYSNLRMNPHRFNQCLIMDSPHKKYGVVQLADIDYSSDWGLAGPIIEREGINLLCPTSKDFWDARPRGLSIPPTYTRGATPLIAAMRCYVASKMGDEINLPEELS